MGSLREGAGKQRGGGADMEEKAARAARRACPEVDVCLFCPRRPVCSERSEHGGQTLGPGHHGLAGHSQYFNFESAYGGKQPEGMEQTDE